MPRVCTVCTHPKRHEIDQQIALGTLVKRKIANENGLSEASVWRHAANCLEPALLEAVGRSQAADAKKLANRVDRIVSRLELRAEQCDDSERVDQLLKIVRELRPYQELYGKAVGELASDKMNALFVKLGVRDEAELDGRVALTRGTENLSPEEVLNSACEALETLFRKHPTLYNSAMRRLEGASVAVEVNGNGHVEVEG